jgi:DNA-binding PadR family transcriptional regulator
MYRDNSLIPSEAIRLLALGLLADRNRTYAEVAGEVRHFTGRMVGPSLDLLASPLELLKVEGLVDQVAANAEGEGALLRITDAGQAELQRLLASNVRPQVTDVNKLIIALKMRFLHLLPTEQQLEQSDLLVEIFERELARLTDLRSHEPASGGELPAWLDLEIGTTQARLAWFEDLRDRLSTAA